MSARGECTEFGPFRLIPAERLLLKNNAPVPVGARELDILIVLVERAGRVVTKRELFARVWPDVVVEESSLRVHVGGLRRALADGQDQARYIVNVPGRGYSFVASVAGNKAPAPNAPGGAPPQRSTRIIGRDNDSNAIAELLAAHRFVTIHGPGGVGKTTLSLAIASAQTLAFADGHCFVDLSLNIGVHTVADALAAALELIVNGDPAASILDFMRGREMLLVLDSCETTIGDAAALAETIIQHAPRVAILATSREPLRTQSEHVYPLEPLSSPPEGVITTTRDLQVFSAAQLFCERAVAAGYRIEFKDADAVIIGEICRRVDGNALALELAASRVSTYGLRQTADLLDSHMKLVWRGRRTAPPRHQTLSAMLDWSYALIDERERRVLRQLSVFVGGFGLDEARGVTGDSDEVIEALEQLVLKSLVAVDTNRQTPRYRLLDTTRAYATAKLLESGGVGEVRRRHARYYLDWLTRSTDVAAAAVEHTPNIRAALEWAFSNEGDAGIGLGLATYACELFLRLGMLTEIRRWSARGLASLPPERAGSLQEMALRAVIGHATMISAGNTAAARESLECALRIAEELGDTLQQFRLLNSMHFYHRRIGAIDELFPIAEHAVQIAPRLGGIAPVVSARAMLGMAHHLKGNLAAAHRDLIAVRDARLGAGEVPNFYGFHRAAEVLIARTLWLMGYPDQAAQSALDANSEDAYKDPTTACLVLMWGVHVHYLLGDWATVDEYVERILAIASEHGFLAYKWYAMAVRGALQLQCGDPLLGVSNLQEYLRRLREGRYAIYTTWPTCCLAEWLASNQHVEQAGKLLNEFNPDPDPKSDVYTPELLRVRGVILAQAGESAAAEQRFEASLHMADAQGALSWRLRTATSVARMRLEQGQLADARELLAATYARFAEGFETADLRTARALLAEIDARLTSRNFT